MAELEACDDTQVWRVWLSAFHAPTLAVADELGLFAAVGRSPSTAEELARALKLEVRAAEALTALMTSLEFLVRIDGRFHLTQVARQCLLPSSPYYWGGFLARIRATPLDCTRMLETLRNAGGGRVGSELWESALPPADALQRFTHAMHAHSFALAMRVVPSFSLGVRFLDAAGGSGSFSIAVATHFPSVACTVLDLPAVCEVATGYAVKAGLTDRISVAPRDMFKEPWPGGFDRVFFNDIFHDWDDARCLQLARSAHGALEPGGRVMLHEMLLSDAKDGPLMAAAFSAAMVFTTRGRQRTAAELGGLLTQAGFVEPKGTPTSGGYALVEAKKA